jgi:hypothetical protein
MPTNKYLSFVSDEHLLDCVGERYKTHQKAKEKWSNVFMY